MYPWDDPNAPEHVRKRQRVWKDMLGPNIRFDLPKRRPAVELPHALQGLNYGAVVMTHNGFENGRLSILLSTLPENLPVHVSSDAIDESEMLRDKRVAEHHGADFSWHQPWDGRLGHAIGCMKATNWDYTLFLMDDVYLFPETTIDCLRWAVTFERHGIPLAKVAIPGWESYHHWMDWGFRNWQHCLDEPQLLEKVPPNPSFLRGPALYKNPFGACELIVRAAYDDLGGFLRGYWAEDDTFNHQVWLSNRWVSACYPGRGYVHYGAQSNHFGETAEWIGSFQAATGMTTDESGQLQVESIIRWKEKLGAIFEKLGGTAAL